MKNGLRTLFHGRDDALTPAQALDTLHWVMARTRDMFLKALRNDFSGARGRPDFPPPDLATATLWGYCGLAQSFIDLTLKDYGIGVSKPFALQTLPREFSHVALTVEMKTTEGKKTYLFDPTFRQFCAGEWKNEPGAVIGALPEGEWMKQSLLRDGFFELTPARAVTYLSAYSGGANPFDSGKKAAAFLAHPKKHEYNTWFSRGVLMQKGLIGLPPKA